MNYPKLFSPKSLLMWLLAALFAVGLVALTAQTQLFADVANTTDNTVSVQEPSTTPTIISGHITEAKNEDGELVASVVNGSENFTIRRTSGPTYTVTFTTPFTKYANIAFAPIEWAETNSRTLVNLQSSSLSGFTAVVVYAEDPRMGVMAGFHFIAVGE